MERQLQDDDQKRKPEVEEPVREAAAEEESAETERESKTKFSAHGTTPGVAETRHEGPTASERAFGDEEFHEYVKTAGVEAEQLTEPLEWTTASGDKMKAEKGDWKITGADGSTWSVKPDIFAKTYSEVGPGHYIKTASTKARVLTKATTIQTLDGAGTGNAGDYLVRGVNGEEYIVTKAKFESMYKRKHEGSSPRSRSR